MSLFNPNTLTIFIQQDRVLTDFGISQQDISIARRYCTGKFRRDGVSASHARLGYAEAWELIYHKYRRINNPRTV